MFELLLHTLSCQSAFLYKKDAAALFIHVSCLLTNCVSSLDLQVLRWFEG